MDGFIRNIGNDQPDLSQTIYEVKSNGTFKIDWNVKLVSDSISPGKEQQEGAEFSIIAGGQVIVSLELRPTSIAYRRQERKGSASVELTTGQEIRAIVNDDGPRVIAVIEAEITKQ